MQQQNWIQNENGGTVHVHNTAQPVADIEESKDEIWQFRLEPRVAARLRSLVNAKGLNRSDFTRDCVELGEVFHDYKDTLLNNSDFVIEMCKRISNPG